MEISENDGSAGNLGEAFLLARDGTMSVGSRGTGLRNAQVSHEFTIDVSMKGCDGSPWLLRMHEDSLNHLWIRRKSMGAHKGREGGSTDRLQHAQVWLRWGGMDEPGGFASLPSLRRPCAYLTVCQCLIPIASTQTGQ